LIIISLFEKDEYESLHILSSTFFFGPDKTLSELVNLHLEITKVVMEIHHIFVKTNKNVPKKVEIIFVDNNILASWTKFYENSCCGGDDWLRKKNQLDCIKLYGETNQIALPEMKLCCNEGLRSLYIQKIIFLQ